MFQQFSVFNFRGKLLSFGQPRVMGILNVTPDSFHDGGTLKNIESAVRRAGKMLREGADIIDIGGQSTRPGAKMVSVKTEMSRVVPVIKALLERYPDALVSADTFRAEVADAAVQAGAVMINDVSAGSLDKSMFKTVARLQVPYVLMHMKGTPETMQKNPVYRDVTETVFAFFADRLTRLEKLGVKDILVDPGFGFGKTPEHNFTLLKNLPVFLKTGRPVLAGLSRKSMICRTLGIPPAKALNGTTALNMAALLGGASVLRVHDVKEAAETVVLFNKLNG